MPNLSPAHVNDILTRYGFMLKKGEAKHLAVTMDASHADESSIVTTALKRGIARSHLNKRPLPILQHDKTQHKKTVQWLSARIAEHISTPDFIEGFVSAIIDTAVESTQCFVEEDTRPPYSGTRVRTTDMPHDLSQLETLGDFLLLPSGEDAVIVNGSVMHLARYWAQFYGDGFLETIGVTAQSLRTMAPAELAGWMSGLKADSMPPWVMEDVFKELSRLGRNDEWFFDTHILNVPLREALLRYRPEAHARLVGDVKSAERLLDARQRREARVVEIVRDVTGQFRKRLLSQDNVYEITNAVIHHIRTPDDLAAAEDVFKHPDMRARIQHDAHGLYKGMVEGFLRLFKGRTVDFSHPLAVLFFTLDDAWKKDGRCWHVCINQNPHTSTFGIDNWMFLMQYALTAGHEDAPKKFGIAITRLETGTGMKSKDLRKTAACLMIYEDLEVEMLSIPDVRNAFEKNGQDGRRLPKDPLMRYTEVEDLSPELAASLDKWVRPHPAMDEPPGAGHQTRLPFNHIPAKRVLH